MQPDYFQATPLNEEAHYDHEECGDRRSRLYVKRTPRGWIYHCHNCGESGFQRAKGLSPKETMMMLEGVKKASKGFYMPPDLTDDLPLAAQLWLEKYGITDEEIKRYQIQYSKGLKRLILPVIEDGKWVFWQGRNLGKASKDNPKYLSVKVPGRDVFFRAGEDSSVVCIVEDILSAIKVGRVTGSIALLGSYIPTEFMKDLKDKQVLVWLDQDKSKDAVKYVTHMYNVFGIEAYPHWTKADPKAQTEEYIQEIVRSHFGN